MLNFPTFECLNVVSSLLDCTFVVRATYECTVWHPLPVQQICVLTDTLHLCAEQRALNERVAMVKEQRQMSDQRLMTRWAQRRERGVIISAVA